MYILDILQFHNSVTFKIYLEPQKLEVTQAFWNSERPYQQESSDYKGGSVVLFSNPNLLYLTS